MHGNEPQRHRDMHFDGDKTAGWRVFTQFYHAMQAHRQLMARMMAERDIHPAQAVCLRELAHNDGMTQRDLASLMCVSRPTVTVMLQKMESAGLVERLVDTMDQRFTRLHLSERGWQLHEEMHRLLDTFVTETIGQLTEDEQAALEGLLGKLNENFAAALGGPAAQACGMNHDDLEEEDDA